MWGIVALIVIIGSVWFFMGSGGSKDEQAIAPTGTTPIATTSAVEGAAVQQAASPAPSTSSPTVTGTIGSLRAMTGDFTCSVTVTRATEQSKGMVFMSGGKIAGNFTATMQGKSVHASLINDGTNIYLWSDASPRGLKLPSSAANTSPMLKDYEDSTPVAYTCSPWMVDASKFVPPSSITFMVLSTAPSAAKPAAAR